MHSRIKQLADECETTYIDRDGYRSVEFDKAKFTELIVRECVQQLRYKSAQLVDVDYFPEYKEQLEKHFGIK